MDEKRRNIFARLMDEAGLPPEEALQMVQGASEVGLSVLTGLAGVAAGLPGSTIETLRGRGSEEQREKYPGLAPTSEDTLLPTVGEMTEKWTYQPKTETGQRYAENVGKVMEPVDKALRGVSGFLPGIVEKVPGDSRLGSGIMNAADQAIYTALNVLSPTRGAGTAIMGGAKGLQAAGRAAGLKNLDLVTPAAQAIEKVPLIRRYNQINNAMGQLITRKQLAGMQPGKIPEVGGVVKSWYKGGKPQHLGVMAKTALWNVKRKMTDNQDAWLRAHYGITANVYKEMERLGNVMDSAGRQAGVRTPDRFNLRGAHRKFLDEDGNMVLHEKYFFDKKISPERKAQLMEGRGNKEHYKSVERITEDASNQYHSQIAYNISVLEKFKPGDPRIARLQKGGLDRYIYPKHKETTINNLQNKPEIIQDLLGKNLDRDLISNHISPMIASDMNLKGNKVHISTKPFFTGTMMNAIGKNPVSPTGLSSSIVTLGRTVVKDGKAYKLSAGKHAPYIDGLRRIVNDAYADGRVLTKEGIIEAFEAYNKAIKGREGFGVRQKIGRIPKFWKRPQLGEANLFDIQYLKKNIVDDGEFISISQNILTNDTLLATMPVRFIINKRNPSEGYFIMYDQMKQGSGFPVVESWLDLGSDTNRIFIDVQPLDAKHIWEGKIPKVKDVVKETMEKELGPKVRQKFDAPPTEEFLKRRRWGRLPIGIEQAAMWGSPAKRLAGVGLLAQDENV